MKVVARTDEYTIYQKRSERYAVKGSDKGWVNGDAKVAILLQHKLIEAPRPKAPAPAAEVEAPAAEVKAPAEDAVPEESVAEAEAPEAASGEDAEKSE